MGRWKFKTLPFYQDEYAYNILELSSKYFKVELFGKKRLQTVLFLPNSTREVRKFMPRFYVPDIAYIKVGEEVVLPPEAIHHAMRVYGMREDDEAELLTATESQQKERSTLPKTSRP